LVRYDIVLIQEIRDSSNKAIYQLLNEVNSMGAGERKMVLSKRLGRSSSKEQYAFFYKASEVSVRNIYQYPDENDVFEREPFIVHFRPNPQKYQLGDFAFLGIHVKPEAAPAEINELTMVYDSVAKSSNITNMLLAGDFNAACTYVSKTELKNISLRNDARFLWAINDNVDTTMTASNCAYDRLVLAGANLQRNYVPGSAVPYKFNVELKLTEELALEVSDHYPVEMRFR